MKKIPLHYFNATPKSALICLLSAACLAATGLATAESSPQVNTNKPNKPDKKSDRHKDIVLDNPAPAVAVQRPAAAANAAAAPAVAVSAASSLRAGAGGLADLGLALLRAQAPSGSGAQGNSIASPVSLMSALGLVHAGAQGASAREIGGLLAGTPSAERVLARDFPALLKKMHVKNAPLTMANRIWLDPRIATQLDTSYLEKIQARYASDASAVDFAKPDVALKSINAWVSQQTHARVPELLAEGAITGTTRLVLTNAVHFKSPWQQPFSAQATRARPFYLSANATVDVPTMQQTMDVRVGLAGNTKVMEIPFEGNDYKLLIAMPPQGQTLQAMEEGLSGEDMLQWMAQTQPVTCRVELPKFAMVPKTVSLRPTLQWLGVQTVFGTGADFTPMLGRGGKDLAVDDVYQSAGITVDETGGEAVAATAVVAVSKSLAMPQPVPDCFVNRPFMFAVVHAGTGVAVFLGNMANPAQ